MAPRDYICGLRLASILVLALLACPISSVAAEETAASPAKVPASASEQMNGKSLWLPQTRSEWDALVARQVEVRDFGTPIETQPGDVTVTAPVLLPMHGVYDEMWTGLLTPVWAILHPAQAWRIF